MKNPKKNQSGKVFVILLVVMVLVFILALSMSARGWGYVGYGGYHHGPSFLYWGGPTIYTNRNVRDGSVGGPNNRGGGYSGGK